MRNLLLLIFFSSISLISLAQCAHNDHNEIRYYNEPEILDINKQNILRNQPVWKEFLSNNGNWYVIFNERTGLPHRAFGQPIVLNNGTDDNASVLNFLNNSFDLPSDLRFANKTINDKYSNINFSQYYRDLEILNSRVYAKLTLDKNIVVFGLDVFSDINLNIIPSVSKEEATNFATNNLKYKIQNISVNSDLSILPIPNESKYDFHLVYTVNVTTRIDEGPAEYLCYVDAHTGDLLMRKNQVLYETFSSSSSSPINSVSGDVYVTNPYTFPVNKKFKYLKAIDQSSNTNYYSDSNGDVNLPLPNGTPIRYKLEGLYADVQTNNSTPDIFDNIGNSNNILFDNSNSTVQERTAYYSVNMIHDHMKNVFPTFTSLDFPIETNVDVSGSCNAYYSSGTINFYMQSSTWGPVDPTDNCHATAKLPDVVYHEYGHAINDYRYGANGMWNGALNEGYADIWALSLTQNPVLGYGWDLTDPTISVRRYDQNRKVYPQDISGEVHGDGEIIAGAFWDTYLNLGNMQQMLDLFKYTYDGAPDGPNGTEGTVYTDVLIEVLYADDNDANITNGTPNDIDIIDAFALHGITLLSNAIITHNPIETALANTDILVNATISLTYPWALDSANLFYRINSSNQWSNVTVPVSSSNALNEYIPSQPEGTVIAYYISLKDIYGYESVVTPMAANIEPLSNANVPYFILVGYEMIETEDFDLNQGVWITGDINDQATTGMWELGIPNPSYLEPQLLSGLVQTGTDNTNGSSNRCAFTGNASVTDGVGTNDIDDGHTTLYSPFYDLSNFTNPAFSYFRWYTNNTGANPGADWWQVLITDDGNNWYYIENNKSAEIAWRKFAFRVKDYVNLTSDVQLKFIASDSLRLGQNLDGGSLVEAAVDDLVLYESSGSISNTDNLNFNTSKLVKIIDVLGRKVHINEVANKSALFYIYQDGTVVKKLFLETFY